MKVERKEGTPTFSPIEIELTIESAEEARALYAIFNRSTNSMLLGDAKADAIINAIGEEHYVSKGLIARGISYNQFYDI